ncbi:hypothetical protein F4805DRAFT_451681 [Annulohypoxylon moriforme]|nr:hypothetical protein F4805DRAFT_451681 [Annulohypoxylon moriforme]
MTTTSMLVSLAERRETKHPTNGIATISLRQPERLMISGKQSESLFEDKILRQSDIQLMGLHNSNLRTAEEYADLFQEADKRLTLRAKYQYLVNKSYWWLEAVWEG